MSDGAKRTRLLEERENLKDEQLKQRLDYVERRLDLNEQIYDDDPVSLSDPDSDSSESESDSESSDSDAVLTKLESTNGGKLLAPKKGDELDSIIDAEKRNEMSVEDLVKTLPFSVTPEDVLDELEQIEEVSEQAKNFESLEDDVFKEVGKNFYHFNNSVDKPREITEDQLLVQAMERRMKEAGEMFDKDLEEMVNVLVKKSRDTLEMSRLIPGRASTPDGKNLGGTLQILQHGYPYLDASDQEVKNPLFEKVDDLKIFKDGVYLEEGELDIGTIHEYIMLYPSSQFYWKDHDENDKEPNFELLLKIMAVEEFWPTASDPIDSKDTVLHEKPQFMNIDTAIEKFSRVLLDSIASKIDSKGTEIQPVFTGKLLLRLLFLRHCMMLKYVFFIVCGKGFDDEEKNNEMDLEYSQLSTVYRRYRMLFNFKRGETIASSFHLNLARHLMIEFFKVYYEIQAIQQRRDAGKKEQIKEQLVFDYDMIDTRSSKWLFIQNTFNDAIKYLWDKKWWDDDGKKAARNNKRIAVATYTS